MLEFFKDSCSTLGFLGDRVNLLATLWCYDHSAFQGVSFSHMQKDWHAFLMSCPLSLYYSRSP